MTRTPDKPLVCLSFDMEEFDLPQEHGVELPLERQIAVSRSGAMRLLDVVERHGVKCTFFMTERFARLAPEVTQRIVAGGHEVASHGMEHSRFETAHLRQSREALESLTGKEVRGFRMARMMAVPPGALAEAGYLYDSSLNPTCIPGRYMHLGKPATPFREGGVLCIPASVTPLTRFPLFWLSAHVLPPALYRRLAKRTLRSRGFLSLYFHPWEFHDLGELRSELRLPAIVCRRAGAGMTAALDALIGTLRDEGAAFGTYSDLMRRHSAG